MAFDDIQAEIGLLLTRTMQDEAADDYELYMQIMQRLNELKAFGMPLPDDLVRLEHHLEADFEADNSERAKSARLDRARRERAKHRSHT